METAGPDRESWRPALVTSTNFLLLVGKRQTMSWINWSRSLMATWDTRGRARRQRSCQLNLEGLQDRSLPSTVVNLADDGPGSLRQATLDTPAGGTVDFQEGLTGTIT